MKKIIRILLCISGIYTLYLSHVFLKSLSAKIIWVAPYANLPFVFFLLTHKLNLSIVLWKTLSYTTLVLIMGIAVIDFVSAFIMFNGTNLFYKFATYRSTFACLFGFLLIVLGRVTPNLFTSEPLLLTTEGLTYFIFYGILFTLLMINERKEKS